MADRNGIRRAQLIAPYGVGAMAVMKDGTSLICGGLDYWFRSPNEDTRSVDLEEFRLEEWRLQRRLGVNHFRLPPDYRSAQRHQDQTNTRLTIPFLRFPRWHFCPSCDYLQELPSSLKGTTPCERCRTNRQRHIPLAQVPLVAVCDHGHLQDFPWREWVHKTPTPSCHQELRLINLGGAGLTSLRVQCDCGMRRSLAGITSGDDDSSELSRRLAPQTDEEYRCKGRRPWFGTDESEPCNRPLRGSPRNATNVYFAKTVSAIYIPKGSDRAPSKLVELLERPPLSTLIHNLKAAPESLTPSLLRSATPTALKIYTDAQLAAALEVVVTRAGPTEEPNAREPIEPDEENNFRYEEYCVIREPHEQSELLIRSADLSKTPFLSTYFSTVTLLHKLRETRVLTGFSRLTPGDTHPDQRKEMTRRQSLMWKELPAWPQRWLPAVNVYGEGVFLEFDMAKVREWEDREDVQTRVYPVHERNAQVSGGFQRRDPVSPRLLLLHTFAHLLITQLTFASGYSAASLRERLYVSHDASTEMAGLLVYTAAGDAEGTLGGLVRLGHPERLQELVQQALEAAKWCSSDPVCMEAGEGSGQGPGALNLAACHSCGLLPETSCEEFNRFLDRGVLVGTFDNPSLGFFR